LATIANMTLFVIVKLSARENVSSLRISELVPYRVMDTAAVREVVPIFSREVMIGRVNQSLPTVVRILDTRGSCFELQQVGEHFRRIPIRDVHIRVRRLWGAIAAGHSPCGRAKGLPDLDSSTDRTMLFVGLVRSAFLTSHSIHC